MAEITKRMLILIALFVLLVIWSYSVPAETAQTSIVDYGVKRVSFRELQHVALSNRNLEVLRAYNAKLSINEIEWLYTTFPSVEFGLTLSIGQHKVRTDATVFAMANSRLSTRYTSEDFAVLRYCTQLRVLDLAHNKITHLEFLTGLSELRILLLGDNQITDLSPLRELHNLEYIELFKNQVNDLTPLRELNNLLDLNICFNYIQDYAPLHNLPKLERLWLYNSNNYKTKEVVAQQKIEILKK